ncbi:MAG: hypothetical protein OXC05_14195 [Halieaceae bacterium]|nr:hypothetical protein [Halieaceae bacterium]
MTVFGVPASVWHRWERKLVLLIFLLLPVLLGGCGRVEVPATFPGSQEDHAQFCSVLQNLNNNIVEVDKQRPVQGHAQVIGQLLPLSPPAIKPMLEQLFELFSRWSRAGDSLFGTFRMFDELLDPGLAVLEGEISDYMIEACGLALPTGLARAVYPEQESSRCPAWPRVGSPLRNNRFPNYLDTSGANYFANQFWAVPLIPAPSGFIDVPAGGSVVFRGDYPRARYFAYHPNDKSTNNLKTLVDIDIEPDPGSVNPWRQPLQYADQTRYTVRYVFSAEPENPQANTRYVGRSQTGGYNPLVMNLLRLYASDLGNSANSGGVKLPSVTVYDAEGNERDFFPECDPYPHGPETDWVETTIFPVMPLPDHRATNPVTWDSYSNFNLPVDILANADVQYFNTVLSQRYGELYVVRARGLSTPNTRRGEFASAAGKDVRFWTVCNYNFWAGRAGTCLLDTEVPLDRHGYYTLVVAPDKYRPDKLGSRHDVWMDWGDYLDTQISYRTGLRDNPKLQQLRVALDGGPVDPAIRDYVPIAIPCSKSTYEEGGWEACWRADSP